MFGYPRPHPPLNFSRGRSPGVKASIMTKTAVKDFMSTKGYDLVSPIRSNTNGYLFCTFLDSKNPNDAENIYLSVKSAKTMAVDKTIDRNWSIVHYTTDEGVQRIKLTNSGEDAKETLMNRGYVAL